MLEIILATSRPAAMPAFIQTLASHKDVHLKQLQTGNDVLDVVRAAAPHLVIIDTGLPDAEPLTLVQKLLMVNAMVNTTVISPLAAEEFHEASEGLGVLSCLPLKPGPGDAAALLEKLRKILGLDNL